MTKEEICRLQLVRELDYEGEKFVTKQFLEFKYGYQFIIKLEVIEYKKDIFLLFIFLFQLSDLFTFFTLIFYSHDSYLILVYRLK